MGQCFQELVIQAVFRFFDAQERRGSRIIEQQKIREHLQRPVRHLLGVKGALKAFIVEPEQQPAVAGSFRINPVYARNSTGDLLQNSLETRRMVALHELHDVAEIVAVDIEMFLWPGQGQATRRVRDEVAQIPSFDELAKSGNSRVLFQRAKRGNAELTMVLQCDEFGIFEFFRFPFFFHFSTNFSNSERSNPSAVSSTWPPWVPFHARPMPLLRERKRRSVLFPSLSCISSLNT